MPRVMPSFTARLYEPSPPVKLTPRMGPFVPYSSTPAVTAQTRPRSSPTVRMAVALRRALSRMVEPPVRCAGPRDAAVAGRRNAGLAAQRPLPLGQRPHDRFRRERLSRAAVPAVAQRPPGRCPDESAPGPAILRIEWRLREDPRGPAFPQDFHDQRVARSGERGVDVGDGQALPEVVSVASGGRDPSDAVACPHRLVSPAVGVER